MKTILQIQILFLLALSINTAKGQGPITPTEGLVGKTEIAVIWENSGYNNGTDITFSHNIIKLRDDFEAVPDKGQRFEINSDKHLMDNLGNSIINAVSGDFNGDTKDEYLVVSHGKDGSINYSLTGLSELQIDSFYFDSFSSGPLGTNSKPLRDNILVESGDFNNDGKQELVMAFMDSTGQVVLQILELNENRKFSPGLIIQDESLPADKETEMFSIDISDLDDNGIPEILMVSYSEEPEPGMYISIYIFSEEGSFEFIKKRQQLDNELTTNYLNDFTNISLDVTAGDLNGDNKIDVIAGFSTFTETADLYLFPVEVKDDPSSSEIDPLEMIVYNSENLHHIEYNWNGKPLNLVTGDVNNDGREDLLATGTENHLIYTTEGSNFDLKSKNFGYSFGGMIKYADIKNIDNQPENGKEILILEDISSDFNLFGYSVNENFEITTLADYSFGTWGKNPGSAVMVTGDFDGDLFKIGPGKKYTKTDIVQPLVILNAPPTHFDMINGEIYDVNECHNGGNCKSYANYTTTNSSNVSVSTTLRESWGVSSTLSGGGKFLGAGVKAYLTGTYGKNFEKTSESSQTVVIQQSVTATFDDQIYATVCDYEIWEYVVYNQHDQPQGNILTLKPILTENRWFPSKERSASGYVPKHEVGNILSYTPYKDLINPDGEEKIRGSYGSDSYDLDANTDVTFSVNLSNTFNNTVVEERRIGVEAGGSISKWGIELSGSARYNRSDLSTHSISVGEALDITVHLGGINRSIGETGYNVTPYIYWGTNGALVIDYAARPILPEPGGTETWWSETYNMSDPAFILPWRLDPEKGLVLQDEEKRERTKSISFSPSEPEEGDTVTVTAVINNFSPYPTAGKIAMSFYIGHPKNGGILIEDINGKTLFETGNVINEQAFQEISFQWIIPDNLTSFPRIYGYIDPLNTLDEIHDDNNIGWTILGKSDEGGPTSTEHAESIESEQRIQVYPNPFNDLTQLQFRTQELTDVAIHIYDVRGKRVYTSFHSSLSPGIHTETMETGDLSPGVYIYRVQTNEFTESGRIIKSF